MSRQAYVDDYLVGGGKVTKAAIFGHDGVLWATSTGFNVSREEAETIMAGFTNNDVIRSMGIRANNQKYFTLRADARSIYGKQGNGGVTCVKTTQTVLVGVYEAPIQPGESVNEIEKLADYLISQDY
ncbi:profilin [Streptomyces tendae]|uniref:profilin n=1 Tax=Streptomyces tendae TaxID=1932 RepID=UPI00341DA4E3